MTTVLPDGVRLDQGAGGLARLKITTCLCTAEMYLHGAHVCRWHPHGHQHPVLWMSDRSWFETGRPIRGGVPICFPWFGPKADSPQASSHGVARTQAWALDAVTGEPDGTILVRLTLTSNDISRAFYGEDFTLHYAARFGTTLDLALTVVNTGNAPMRFEEALHTYLTVSDARHVSVAGLGGAEYYDKTDGMKRKRQSDDAVTITGKTNRLYVDTSATVTLADPGLERRILIAKTGSRSTVVWNPGTARSAALPDFGDDEWPGMTCVETVNASDNAITLDARQSHTMTTTVSVEPIAAG
jgi:glucose-6-phosphate 1-epimerase